MMPSRFVAQSVALTVEVQEAWFDRKVHASWTDPEDDDKFPTSQNLLTEKHLQAMKKELASSMALLIMLPYTGEEAPVHWLDHKLIQLAREMKVRPQNMFVLCQRTEWAFCADSDGWCSAQEGHVFIFVCTNPQGKGVRARLG